MTKPQLGALLAVALCAQAALAGSFIDERGSKKAETSAVETSVRAKAMPGTVTGDFADPAWHTPAPAMTDAQGVPLAEAVMQLRPRELASLMIDAPDDLLDVPVRWRTGEDRIGTLRTISRENGVNLDFTVAGLRMSRVAPPPEMVPGPAGVPVAATAPVKTYEVKLSDIKLSRAFARWAEADGVRMQWDADRQVVIEAPNVFRAQTAYDAMVQALGTPAILHSEYPLEVCEYANVPKLERITRRGEQSKDCPN